MMRRFDPVEEPRSAPSPGNEAHRCCRYLEYGSPPGRKHSPNPHIPRGRPPATANWGMWGMGGRIIPGATWFRPMPRGTLEPRPVGRRNASFRPTSVYSRGWRPADAIITARGRIVKPTGEHSERVSAMRGPIVQRVLAPILKFVIVLTTVLAQCLDATLAAIDVNPDATKHPPHEVDPIQDTRFRDYNRINSKGI